jgi:hypothetical protein
MPSILPATWRALYKNRYGTSLNGELGTNRSRTCTLTTQDDLRRGGTEFRAEAGGNNDAIAGGQARHGASTKLSMNLGSRIFISEGKYCVSSRT